MVALPHIDETLLGWRHSIRLPRDHYVRLDTCVDRVVHHAGVISLKGDSYRLKDRDLGRVPQATNDDG